MQDMHLLGCVESDDVWEQLPLVHHQNHHPFIHRQHHQPLIHNQHDQSLIQ